MYLENDTLSTYTYIVHCQLFRYCSIGYSFYHFPLHVHRYARKYFKHYYNNGIDLVIKFVFNDVDFGPLVLGHKMHQQRVCTLSKIIGIWHPLSVHL